MTLIDWIVLVSTIGGIVMYGIYRGKQTKHSLQGFLLADRELPWYHVLLSVMATQASAITFLSAPGQAYTDGMRFVQFYLGLPIAMIVLSVTFIPNYYRLKVYTAYQFLEQRFDSKTRVLTSLLFLIPRALSTGVTIAAPSIILSTLLGWNLSWTNALTATLVTTYCMMGGSKAISYTQMLQMSVVLAGMFLAAVLIIHQLPEEIGVHESLLIAGKMDKINLIDWKFDINNRYNFWSGIIGGFFLQLSYFGTDQSQVGRYLSGQSATASKKGLLLNGFLKIPMQFLILLVGIFVYIFYQFQEAPIFFNKNSERLWSQQANYKQVNAEHRNVFEAKKQQEVALVQAIKTNDVARTQQLQSSIQDLQLKQKELRSKAVDEIKKTHSDFEEQDTNYVFLRFITDHLPIGIVGFLIAMILLASMGSMASAFGSLTSTSMVDNILGSWFYGTILGVFLCAFYLPRTSGNQVFWAALVAEAIVIYAWYIDLMAFLWLNVLGCLLVMAFAGISSLISPSTKTS
jgi:SSS family transporter